MIDFDNRRSNMNLIKSDINNLNALNHAKQHVRIKKQVINLLSLILLMLETPFLLKRRQSCQLKMDTVAIQPSRWMIQYFQVGLVDEGIVIIYQQVWWRVAHSIDRSRSWLQMDCALHARCVRRKIFLLAVGTTSPYFTLHARGRYKIM